MFRLEFFSAGKMLSTNGGSNLVTSIAMRKYISVLEIEGESWRAAYENIFKILVSQRSDTRLHLGVFTLTGLI